MSSEIKLGSQTEKEALPDKRSGMVTVGCKHPSGLVLEIDESREEAPTPGANKVKVHYPTGRKVTLNGSNSTHPDSPQVASGRVVGGYGLTNVPEDFWSMWTAQHQDFPMLKNGTLFAHPTQDGITTEAANRRTVKNGMEPMDPERPGPGLERDNGKTI